jgi:hypothetical protein
MNDHIIKRLHHIKQHTLTYDGGDVAAAAAKRSFVAM